MPMKKGRSCDCRSVSIFLRLRKWCMWIHTFTLQRCFAPKIRKFFNSWKNRLNTKIQSQMVLFYHVKTLTQLCLHLTCIKHCRSAQITVCANGCVIFLEREPNSFLKILSSSEFSKILVSGNSERESELIQKFTIKRLCFFSACWERLRRHICPSRVWVRFLLLYLN